MVFKIGEKVTFLSEAGYGIILSFKDEHTAVIEDETGFDRPYPINQLVKIMSENYKGGGYSDKDEDETPADARHTIKQERDGLIKKSFWELDLHMHELVSSEDEMEMTDAQKLRKQISEFKKFFKRASNDAIRKIVVIHGVGEGVLKNEIRDYLEKKEQITFYDADFREYGKGATAVEFNR